MNNRDIVNRYLLDGVKNGTIDKEMSLIILKEINNITSAKNHDMAVIGIGCKFPFADNADEYWFNLKNGVDVVRPLPAERAKDMGVISKSRAGWLESISGFDASFFRISPKEAILMHPSQRMFLETAWETLEDAGCTNDGIFGANIGVFVGNDHTYQLAYGDSGGKQDLLTMAGSMSSVLASRIAFVLNLRGPNLVVDTACSSGLVAVHLACKALTNGECEMALAGGLNFRNIMDTSFEGVEAADGKLSAFDKKSNGTVWGEGIGFVLLKPLEKAVRDKDYIYAVVKGSAVRNDGTTNGVTAPSADTQAETILLAWEDAGIDPDGISYIEAHATGTVLGDPIEVKGIKSAFERYTDRKQFCGIGTVKPNVGHGVGVAAVASFIKVILSMKNRQLPPNINFSDPNPFIDFVNSPLYVNDKLSDWESGGKPLLAGINSFGFSRTNCHVVLQEHIPTEEKTDDASLGSSVFLLSAKSRNALSVYLRKYRDYMKNNREFSFADVCYTAAAGRLHFSCRLAVFADDREDLVNKIREIVESPLDEIKNPHIIYGEHKVLSDKSRERNDVDITSEEKSGLDGKLVSIIDSLEGKDDETRKNILIEVCGLYVKGGSFDWKKIHRNRTFRKTSLPTYPFEHKKYWIERSSKKTVSNSMGEEAAHPLFDRCIASTLDVKIYSTEFRPETHWVVNDHVIMNMHIVPGTAFIEMARAAVADLAGNSNITLRNIVFRFPLYAGGSNVRETHTIVEKRGNSFVFKIASRPKDGSHENSDDWTLHAEGSAELNSVSRASSISADDFLSSGSIKELFVDMSVQMGGFEFGPHWRNIERIRVSGDSAVTEIVMDDKFCCDIGEYVLHPSLLDNALNMAAQKIVKQHDDGMFLPLSYGEIRILDNIPSRFFSLQKIRDNQNSMKGSVTLDVTLTDTAGKVLVEIKDYTLKKTDKLRFGGHISGVDGGMYHSRCWTKCPAETGVKAGKHSYAVFSDGSEVVNNLTGRLRNEGNDAVEVFLGKGFSNDGKGSYIVSGTEEDYKAFFDTIKGMKVDRIVLMTSLGMGEAKSLEDLRIRKENGVLCLFRILRAMAACGKYAGSEIILVADYSDRIDGSESVINPHNAALFAAGRVVKSEFGVNSCRSIDIDSDTGVEDIISEIMSASRNYMTAYRKGVRYVEEFTDVDPETFPDYPVELKESGVYLIAGGFGGLGLLTAKHLSLVNKVNIALMGTSSLPDRKHWDSIFSRGEDNRLLERISGVLEIEKNGSSVTIVQADITSEEDMRNATDSLRNKFGRINGVFQCAGLAGEGMVVNKDPSRLEKVISVKADGTYLLDKYTRVDSPDFFVMYSSILSIVGSPGQFDYAAANAYMDSFAAYRGRSAGRTLSVNWTVWAETGMAAGYDLDKVRGIFRTIGNADGMASLDTILRKKIEQIAVGKFDSGRIKSSDDLSGLKLTDEFGRKIKALIDRNNTERECFDVPKKGTSVRLKGGDKASATEKTVAQIWADVLCLEEIGLLDNFGDLGGDSILSMNLLSSINGHFPNAFEISDIFSYPTIKLMAGKLDSIIGKQSAGNKAASSSEASADTDLRIERILDRLSKNEISMSEADDMIAEIGKE